MLIPVRPRQRGAPISDYGRTCHLRLHLRSAILTLAVDESEPVGHNFAFGEGRMFSPQVNVILGSSARVEAEQQDRAVQSTFRWITIVLLCISFARPATGQSSSSNNQPSSTQAKVDPQPEQLALAEARADVERGFLEKADQAVRRYLEAHPDSADGHFLLGLILFRQNKSTESLSEYTEGAKHHTPSAEDLKMVALNYVVLGDYSNADHWLTRSLQWNPKDSQTWYYLGRAKYNETRFAEALGAFQECLKLDPKNVKAEDNLGLSQQALGHTAEALAAFRNAIAWQSQLLKKNSGPYLNLGILFLEQNEVEEALTYLVEATEISPEDSRVHEQMGKAYSRLNDFERAQAELEKAVALSPDSAPLHFMLGQLYRKRGMSEKAKAELERGEALNAAKEKPKAPQAPN